MKIQKTKPAVFCIAAAFIIVFALLANFVSEANSEDLTTSVDLPVIMYHSIREDGKYFGKYVISPQQLKQDFEYLKEHGYTPVSVSQLIEYVNEPMAQLPEKPILITFDDGYYNNYVYAYPLLKEYEFKALISIVGIYSEKESAANEVKQSAAYSYLKWEQIREMTESGYVEIGHHSYDMHSASARQGSKIKSGESREAYAAVFAEDIIKLNNLLIDNSVNLSPVYTYPFGAYCAESETVIKTLGFSVSLTCEEGINTIKKDSGLYLLKRFNRPYGLSSEEFFKDIGVE